MVSAAWAINKAMDAKCSCGNCNNGLPPDYVPPVPDSPPPADSSSDSSSDPMSSCGSSVSNNYDYYGGDLSDTDYSTVADASECCSLCSDRADCYSW